MHLSWLLFFRHEEFAEGTPPLYLAIYSHRSFCLCDRSAFMKQKMPSSETYLRSSMRHYVQTLFRRSGIHVRLRCQTFHLFPMFLASFVSPESPDENVSLLAYRFVLCLMQAVVMYRLQSRFGNASAEVFTRTEASRPTKHAGNSRIPRCLEVSRVIL